MIKKNKARAHGFIPRETRINTVAVSELILRYQYFTGVQLFTFAYLLLTFVHKLLNTIMLERHHVGCLCVKRYKCCLKSFVAVKRSVDI